MLKDLKGPEQLKQMSLPELDALAQEIRRELISTVSECGGHLASNLGIVELTIAMHRVFNCPEDKFLFDVGHQSYVHKLLTGRYEAFHTLRKEGGLSGFPNTEESACDTFAAGHASTAISAALGIARARDIRHEKYNVVSVVGDGALNGGMCYEALDDAGQSRTRMIVILNDNEMSISRNVGAISLYLNGLRQSRGYRSFKRGVRRALERIPGIGTPIFKFIEKIRDALKSLFVDGKFFEALGFTYVGPIDGHDLKHLIRVLERARTDKRPVLIHVVTQKGRGYSPAEDRPDAFHGVAPFYIDSGKTRSAGRPAFNGKLAAARLCDLAAQDERVCVVTAAMVAGTGMMEFQQRYPKRFFDVGIAEEHAVTMAAGLASAGMRPFVAIYSTFLQRSYDQILNDVCRCQLPVTFLLDHAGFVGADGKTHQGLYDLSYLRAIPNLIIAAPRSCRDLLRMIDLSLECGKPMAIRYPKDALEAQDAPEQGARFAIGEWETLFEGGDVVFFAEGPMVQLAVQCALALNGRGVGAGVVDARFIKPMDEAMLLAQSRKARLVATIEENSVLGGLGEGVAHTLAEHGLERPIEIFGASDAFVSHARVSRQREMNGLTPVAICARIEARLAAIREESQ